MKLSVIIALGFYFLAMVPAVSQESSALPVKDPTDIITQINHFAQITGSITADFLQEKEMSFMEETVTSSGKFYYKKDKLLRWEYLEPFNYAIILNKSRIRIIDEGQNKDFDAGSNRIFLEISDIMSGMINGTLLNSDKFRAEWFESPRNYIVQLVPVSSTMEEYLSMIILDINKQDYSVDGLKMVEKTGDFTFISFTNKKFNEAIPVDMFRVD